MPTSALRQYVDAIVSQITTAFSSAESISAAVDNVVVINSLQNSISLEVTRAEAVEATKQGTIAASPGELLSGPTVTGGPPVPLVLGNNLTIVSGTINSTGNSGGVTSFNSRTGSISLNSSDINTALGFAPQQQIPAGSGFLLEGPLTTGANPVPVVMGEYVTISNGTLNVNTGVISVDGLTGSISISQLITSLGLNPPAFSSFGTLAGDVADGSSLASLTSLVNSNSISISGKQPSISAGTNVILGAPTILGGPPIDYTLGSNISLSGTTLEVNIGVSTFNTRTGNVTLTASDIDTALGFTPATAGALTTETTRAIGAEGSLQTSINTNSAVLLTKQGTISSSSGLLLSGPTINGGNPIPITIGSNLSITSQTLNATSSSLITPTNLTWSSTLTIAMSGSGTSVYTTATSNATLTVTGAVAGMVFQLDITQDSTGSRVVTFPSNMFFQNGITPVLSTAPGARDVLLGQVLYDGNILIGAIYSIAV